MDRNISIQKISEEAGVSTATVSRVINCPEKVSSQTRMRVESVIHKYHYRPNLLARGLRHSQMPIFGIMVPDIANEFFANIVIALQQYMFDNGYWAIICNSNKSKVMQQSYLKLLMDQNISGLIVISYDSTNIELPTHIPIVFIDRHPMDCDRIDKHAIIESDNYQGGILATEELIRIGCHKIVFITTSEVIHVFADRLEGYKAALEKHSIAFNPSFIQKVDGMSTVKGKEAVENLLSSHTDFDGIFAAADVWAIGALQQLKIRGVSVPNQVGLVGFDDFSMMEYCYPSITSVHQYPDQLASTAVSTLISMVHSHHMEPLQYILPVELIRRESTVRSFDK